MELYPARCEFHNYVGTYEPRGFYPKCWLVWLQSKHGKISKRKLFFILRAFIEQLDEEALESIATSAYREYEDNFRYGDF